MAQTTQNYNHLRAQKVFGRMPQDDDELWWFVRAVWGVIIPRTRVCKGHCAPFEAFADAYFARYPVTVWKASRGFGGKTNQLSLLSATEAVTLAADLSVLGGSGAQSLRVTAHMNEHWESPNAPKNMLVNATRYNTQLSNGAEIQTLMASQASVRGAHPQRLRLDEIDEMDSDILEGAQGQPMQKTWVNPATGKREVLVDTQTVMSSTHQYPDKTMSIILARAKENRWPVYEWCWRESSNPTDGWLTKEEVARKRTEVTAAMWDTEYDLQEPSFEGRAIDTEAVDHAFNIELGTFDGHDGERIKIEEPEKHGGAEYRWPYITAVDWAKEHDWTVVATFRTDETPWKCVAWQRYARLPWPSMVAMAEKQYKLYGGRFVHDATGIGNVIEDYLTIDKRASKAIVLGGGRQRSDLFNEYISGIEAGDILYPRIEYAYNEHKYATMKDLFGTGHAPDSFIVGALAWSLRKRGTSHVPVVPVGIEKQPGWAI